MSIENSTLKVPKFDGKRESYALWKVQFQALLSLKGCLEALGPAFKSELPESEATTLDASDAGEKKQIEAKEKNQKAMNLITLAMQTAQMLSKIEASKSAKWPGGLAYVFMEKMDKKFKPKDTIEVAEQTQKLMKLRLGQRDSPEDLGEKIAALETRYGSILSEEQKVAAIVNAGGTATSHVQKITYSM